MSTAVIAATRMAASHDGIAELVVTLRHGNGATSEVSLDQIAASALLRSCGVDHPDQLHGAAWEQVRDALAVSWNRFQA
jgi:hypothetical protein